MGRLCERPGCSEPASVAYGMRPEDLIFWLDRLLDSSVSETGVLCQRHADSMVVPRNWTLDDLRDPDLHLFRPPRASARGRRRPERSESSGAEPGEQLELGVDRAPPAATPAADGPVDASPVDGGPVDGRTTDGGPEDGDPVDGVPVDGVPYPVDGEHPDAWTPAFDSSDDLDGLLDARSPLLARAFRGDDRPRT